MVFLWSLSDRKSPQVSTSLLNILTDRNNAVFSTVSTRSVVSMSFSPCIIPLLIVPRAQITICIIVTFMFHRFFNSLEILRYISFFSLSYNFTLWSAEITKSTIWQVLSFWLIIIRSCRLAEIRWFACISKPQMSLCVSFSMIDSGLRIHHLFVMKIFNFLHIFQGVTFPAQSCLVLYSSCANL